MFDISRKQKKNIQLTIQFTNIVVKYLLDGSGCIFLQDIKNPIDPKQYFFLQCQQISYNNYSSIVFLSFNISFQVLVHVLLSDGFTMVPLTPRCKNVTFLH